MADTIKVAIPAYFLPSPGTTLWDQAVAYTSSKLKFMVANVSSGPGTAPADADYVAEIAATQALGIKVIGYVRTRYGDPDVKTQSAVLAEVDLWYSLYGVDGIFFDEVYQELPPTTATERQIGRRWTYYHAIYTAVKAKHATRNFVVLNPGTTPAERYTQICDVICVFEGTDDAHASFEFPAWQFKYSSDKFWHIVKDCADAAAMTIAFNKAVAKNAGYIYITDDSGADPYNSLPTYISDLFALVKVLIVVTPPVIPTPAPLPPFAKPIVVPGTIRKDQAQTSIKKIWKESFSLNPATLINLYMIDVSDILFDNNLQNIFPQGKFYFHNNVKFLDSAIYWDEDKDTKVEKFIAAPIIMDGFETSSKGVLPTPRMSITVSESGIETLALLKQEIWTMGDLVGAKVTRIRTFAKFLPSENDLDLVMSDEWAPDPYSEFPRDIYYVERLENMDKLSISYVLSSILDVEGIQIPFRRVLANNCSHSYRGEGCLYEYKANRENSVHGRESVYTTPEPWPVSIMPVSARAVANDKDELIFGDATSILKIQPGAYKEIWRANEPYIVGDAIYIKKAGIKYHFVCRVSNTGFPPPNKTYWQEDLCSKTVRGCKIRWGTMGVADVAGTGLTLGNLPFGGFSSVSRLNNR